MAQVTSWPEDCAAIDPWARLNEALAADRLEKVPTERFVAEPESDLVPDFDRIAQQYADDSGTPQNDRH